MSHCCSIIPPQILRNLARNGDVDDRVAAREALVLIAAARDARQVAAMVAGPAAVPEARLRRTIYDARQTLELPGRRVRSEGSKR